LFRPQHHKVPFSLTPQVLDPLVLIEAQPLVATLAGTSRRVLVPSPTCP
jgi:hypothetical protein